jgi:hypothetical protein
MEGLRNRVPPHDLVLVARSHVIEAARFVVPSAGRSFSDALSCRRICRSVSRSLTQPVVEWPAASNRISSHRRSRRSRTGLSSVLSSVLDTEVRSKLHRGAMRPFRMTAAAHQRRERLIRRRDRQHTRTRVFRGGEHRATDAARFVPVQSNVLEGNRRIVHRCSVLLSRCNADAKTRDHVFWPPAVDSFGRIGTRSRRRRSTSTAIPVRRAA